MHRRASLVLILIATMLPGAVSAAAQANRAPAKTYKAPRTPDGQPDLQGFWTNSSYVPLERPKGVTKEFYTKEMGKQQWMQQMRAQRREQHRQHHAGQPAAE